MATRVTLHFDLDENVTPELFAEKVALAVSSGALRPGESVVLDRPDGLGVAKRWTVTEEKQS